jgi:hypothetical protein
MSNSIVPRACEGVRGREVGAVARGQTVRFDVKLAIQRALPLGTSGIGCFFCGLRFAVRGSRFAHFCTNTAGMQIVRAAVFTDSVDSSFS